MRRALIALLTIACSSKNNPEPTFDAGGGGPDGKIATCAPGASCTAAVKDCIGLVDNTGKSSFGLRVDELDYTRPAAFTTGIIPVTLRNAVLPDLAACNLSGQGTSNLLLQLDEAGGTATIGSAKPVVDPTAGYTFETDFPSVQTSLTSGSNFATGAAKFTLASWLDAAATNAVPIPLSNAVFTGMLSPDQSCIGTYNADGLDPNQSCEPDGTHPSFIVGGILTAYISLEDADAQTIAPLGESLCVLLSGDAATYGDGASPVAHCKRDSSGKIVFAGDFCSTGGPCTDAVQVIAAYAASSVTIN